VDFFDNYVEMSPTCLLDSDSLPDLPVEKSLDYLLDDL
jgi:hypothetical protein